MPVPCTKCGEWVELDSTKGSPLSYSRMLICSECYDKEDEVYQLLEEAKDINYDLENHAEHMKGDRRGWKQKLKELKEKISKLGYDFNELCSYP